jgi:hypothetical protein
MISQGLPCPAKSPTKDATAGATAAVTPSRKIRVRSRNTNDVAAPLIIIAKDHLESSGSPCGPLYFPFRVIDNAVNCGGGRLHFNPEHIQRGRSFHR